MSLQETSAICPTRKEMNIDKPNNGIEMQRSKAGFHFREELGPGLVFEMSLNRMLFSCESEFQQVDVVETYFGKTLVTDGKTQSTQFDEFAYHESLVHPALLNFASCTSRPAKSVFIGGGGEMATAREVLRHPNVERVVMVDLDEKVVETCIKHLPEWGGEKIRQEPRLELIIGDAYAYLLDCRQTFDAIILDISDPIEAGPGIMLYTKELYQHASTLLSPSGVFVTQAGLADGIPPPHADAGKKDTVCFAPIRNTLAEVFSCVVPYTQCIPSYGSDWGFVMAFNPLNGKEPSTLVKEWENIAPTSVDELIEKYILGGGNSLKMYDGITHRRMFAITKPLREHLEKDNRVMTKENPVFMY